jgi:hypothetical protein
MCTLISHSLKKIHQIHFQGKGVLDRVEDGRVYGRLDDGRTFTCLFDDIALTAKKGQMYDKTPTGKTLLSIKAILMV